MKNVSTIIPIIEPVINNITSLDAELKTLDTFLAVFGDRRFRIG